MTCAASLAYHRLLGQTEDVSIVYLMDVDLTSVPIEHLAALASWVTSSCEVFIEEVKGIDLASVLNSLKCHQLWITCQSLGREETQALVQAMESGVVGVNLILVTLDMETMVTYSGRGRCWKLSLGCHLYNTEMKNEPLKEPLKCWAMCRDWEVIEDYGSQLRILRK